MAAPEQQSARTLEAALSYHRRGLRVTPVKHRSKAAVLDDWRNRKLDESDIRANFEGVPRNVGIVLGEASEDLVDVDLDCAEAIALGDEFLPETRAVFERKSKPKSHRLYYAPGASTFKCKDVDGKTLIELRANGTQTVFYPAIRARHRKEGQSFDNGDKTARSLTGRIRRIGGFTEKINHPVQGTAAGGMKMALALLWERRDECTGAVPILAVHDEIVVECDGAKAEEAREWLVRAMKDGMDAVVNADEPRVPIEVEASVSKAWGD